MLRLRIRAGLMLVVVVEAWLVMLDRDRHWPLIHWGLWNLWPIRRIGVPMKRMDWWARSWPEICCLMMIWRKLVVRRGSILGLIWRRLVNLLLIRDLIHKPFGRFGLVRLIGQVVPVGLVVSLAVKISHGLFCEPYFCLCHNPDACPN